MNKPVFSRYQKFVIALLAFIQFTVVLDFMIMGPMGALLLKELDITTAQFGWVVSAYAFSAGASGILSAGFSDRFDRKRLLLFFYGGFVLGTLFCGLAPSYRYLLAARIITGLFGGVLNGVALAIVADLFAMEVRGRVMGVVQTAFAASQVLGLPFGLFLSNHFGWHAPFLMIVAISSLVGLVVVFKLKPIREHLSGSAQINAAVHLFKVAKQVPHLQTFAATMLLATGGFMIMPFASAFSVANLGISLASLPWVYLSAGIASFFAGPLMGKLSDIYGKFRVFAFGSVLGVGLVLIYCNLGVTPLWAVILINMVLFVGLTARIVSAQALFSGVPAPKDRGAFMSVNGSISQLSGGIAATLAGMIVVQTPEGPLHHFDTLGWVVAGTMLTGIFLMYRVNNLVFQKSPPAAPRG